MKAQFALLLLPAFGAACFAQEDSAPRNELAFGLGGIPALSRSDSPSLDRRIRRGVSGELRASILHQ